MNVQIENKTLQTYKPSAAMQELLERPYALPGDPAEDVYILGVSGGVDSSALAIWMTMKFPQVHFQYFFTDTQADHSETYKTLEMVESFLGRKIEYITPPKGLYELVESYGGFIPSANKRYCTRELKIEPLERKMAYITPFMSMARVHSFVGLRSDEPGRVGYSSENDAHQIHFPFREVGIVKKDVFRIMDETGRIPRFYLHKSRSGCSCCPFQRKGELTMQIQWFPKDHERAKSIERLHEVDQKRFKEDPVPATLTSGLARNWLSYPLPSSWEPTPGVSLNAPRTPGQADLFVAVEFELGTPYFGEPFVGFAQIVATSTSAAGIKKQVDSRWAHLLDSLWLKHDDEEQCRRDTRYVIYHIKADERRLDTSREYHEKTYTLQAKWSLQQAEHWLKWAESVLLHAGSGLARESQTDLAQMVLYAPKDPVIDELTDSREQEIEEEFEEEGSRAICFACSI